MEEVKKWISYHMLSSLHLLENIHDLNHWLSFYIVETCNCQGEKYPPKTLYQLCSHLLCHARENIRSNFVDMKDSNFKPLHKTIDNIFKELWRQGIGSERKHTEVKTKQYENLLWTTNVIGIYQWSNLTSTSCGNEQNVSLWGSMDHRDLTVQKNL